MTKNNFIFRSTQWILEKGWPYLILIPALYFLFYKQLLQSSPFMSIAIGLIPLLVIMALFILKNSRYAFFYLFALQFLAVVPTDFLITYPMGIVTSILCVVMTLLLLIYYVLYDKSIEWKISRIVMLHALLLWCAYCVIELANPNAVFKAWQVMIFQYAIYPVLCFILVPVTVKNIKGINILLIIWSVFVIICIAIAFKQQYFGWNSREKYFLFVLDGAKTHIIWSGIRYFSCFTDAANFGVHMAMAATTFGISAFYVKSRAFKLYYFVIMLFALYGMGISGTRSAIAIPLGALITVTILSRNLKITISAIFLLIFLYFFFAFTQIGNGNQYIFKMRSAFHPSTDPSYIVRVENRKKIKELMLRKPIGYGLGLSKKGLYKSKERMPYPPDSFLVSVWVETGYIGLAIYLVVHLFCFIYASWVLLYKVRSKRVRGLITAWLAMVAGFFISTYVNDVMQYPNPIVVYTGFALCIAAPYIDQYETTKATEKMEPKK